MKGNFSVKVGAYLKKKNFSLDVKIELFEKSKHFLNFCCKILSTALIKLQFTPLKFYFDSFFIKPFKLKILNNYYNLIFQTKSKQI